MKRVRVRNENLTNTIHYIPEELMISWIQFFQKPDINELQIEKIKFADSAVEQNKKCLTKRSREELKRSVLGKAFAGEL